MRPIHALIPFVMLAGPTFAQLLQSWTGQYVLNASYVDAEFFQGFNTAVEKNLSYARRAGAPWPKGGEIDVIEGVDPSPNPSNLGSLHTTANCTMPQYRPQKGVTVSTICDTAYNYNQGCGTTFIEPTSYGATFNQAGGGYYMMERRADKGISMWFSPRSKCPTTLLGGDPDVNAVSSSFMPDVFYPTQKNCNYAEHFDAHSIVFDLTLCEDWAGSPSVWNASACSLKAKDCTDFVANNPMEFAEAYWEINSLKIYTRKPNSLIA
ncbi:hypothetical protein BS17DRAFT_814265 [Gyrodon lividus]|nr:hypothetical protein BS17DRAFT_814265 [Gyrodon lividus]